MDLTTAKDIAAIAAPLTTIVVNSFFKPKLDSLAAIFTKNQKKIEHVFLDRFNEYLVRSYEQQSYVRTVVFQNNKKLLNDLYIPLTVVNPSSGEKISINTYPKNLLPVYDKVLIVDTAGMGKSTISRFLFLSVINNNSGIPVFLELRQLKNGKTILELIQEDVNSIDTVFDKDLLLKLISEGGFIFFFDGFDEIALSEREKVTNDIQSFVSKAHKNKFLITSRPDPALASFADFQQFFIKPLLQSEAFSLLSKYDGNSNTSKALINKLKKDHHREQLKTFLVNPLLVSLLFKAYDFKPTLPLRVDVFYRQVYEALFENHDISKGDSFARDKFSKLNIDDFARVLRILAMKTAGLGQVQYTADELIGHLKYAKERSAGLVFSESDFIKDLTSTVPLFVKEGLDYRWSHKSFQEYFAAMFISYDAKGDAEKLLHYLSESKERDRFVNILELYHDIDPPTFHRCLTKNLIDDFFQYIHGESYGGKYIGVDKNDVLYRKLVCFSRKFVLFPSEMAGKNKDSHLYSEPSKVHKYVRDYCVEKHHIDSEEHIDSSTYYSGGGALVVMGKKNLLVMNILNRKNNHIIVDLWRLLPRNKREVNADVELNDIIKGNKELVVSDDPKNKANSKDKFSKVTHLLIVNPKIRVGLDVKKCEEEMERIKQIISRDNIKDFFNITP